MKNKTKFIAFMGLFVALALILAWIEVLLPPIFPAVPGIKVGLPNLVIIFLLYRRSAWTALNVSLVRIVLVSLLFGNIVSFIYSIVGGLLSLAVMVPLKKYRVFSPVGVSVAGGVTHNLGQILAAMVLLETAEIGYYMVVLTVTGTVAGVFVGLGGYSLIKKVPSRLLKF